MDVLGDVLAMTRIGSTVVCAIDLIAPWGVRVEPQSQTSFLIVRRGSCWLGSQGRPEPVELHQGDVVLLMPGGAHTMANPREATVRPREEILSERVVESGRVQPGDGPLTAIYHGIYHFDHDGPHPLLSLLPKVLHVPADEVQTDEALRSAVRIILGELSRGAPGFHTAITRMQDALFVFVVRRWLEHSGDACGWLRGLRDGAIARALSEMHGAPERPWTVASLAAAVSMSRAAFAKRFHELVGEPPRAYLTRWRLDVAARLLRESEWSIARIAHRIGYEGETSFSRAFRRRRGVAPGAYRKRARAALANSNGITVPVAGDFLGAAPPAA